MRRRFFEQVLLGADGGNRGSHHLLADRIDRRIGHLGEKLLEVVEQQRRLVRQHRQRRVGAHRAHRLLPVDRHRRQDHLQLFDRVAEGLLLLGQIFGLEAGDRRRVRRLGKPIEIGQVFVEPLPIRLALRHRRLDFLVLDDAALDRVDEKHAARLQAALALDLLGRDVEHAGFGSHHDHPVLGHQVARGTQPVAVEHRADAAAVGERDRRRPVPRLHQARMVLVERALARAHHLVVLPRLRDHHHHGVRQRAPGAHQQLQTIVEHGRVTAGRFDDRQQLMHVVAEQRRGELSLPRGHPVDIAAQRVDLAVVAQEAVRMRAVPARKGVGRKPLMDHRERGLDLRIAEVGIELRNLIRDELAFVNDGRGRETAEVEQLAVLEAERRRSHR